MADLTKLLEEVKGMSVLELNDFVKMLEEEFGVSAAAMAVAAPAAGAQAMPLPLPKSRPSSTSSSKRLAATRLPLSRLSAKSPALAFPKQKLWLTVLPPLLRKRFPKRLLTKLPRNSRLQAQPQNSSNNFGNVFIANKRKPVTRFPFFL